MHSWLNWRAGFRWGPALFVFLGLVGGALAEPPGELPGEAEGEIPFFADATLFLTAEGSEELYVACLVPEASLECVARDSGGARRAEIRVWLASLDEEGQTLLERSVELALPCSGRRGESQRLVYVSAPWPGGPLLVQLKIEDRNALRQGLLYRITGAHRRGLLRARAARPDLSDGRGLSGALFLGRGQPAGFELQERIGVGPAGRGVAGDPNPRRAYGLARDTLAVYWEVYGLAGETPEMITRVRRATGGAVLYEHRQPLRLAEPRHGLLERLAVGELPSGTYRLELDCVPAAGETLRSGGRFQMLWRADSWSRSAAAGIAEASLLLPSVELERFRQLEAGEREAYLESLWVALDGYSTAGFDGPTRARFLERVALADARYGGRHRGSQTDRGRVLIRYGEPDEVHKELIPREREQIAVFLEEEIDDAERGETGGAVSPHPYDSSAYEVWYYVNRGEPLLSVWEPPSQGRALKFIFLDRVSQGEYRLIYTNLYGGFK